MPDRTRAEAATGAVLERELSKLLAPLSSELRERVSHAIRDGKDPGAALRLFLRDWRRMLRNPALRRALAAAAQRAAQISAQRLKAVDPKNKKLQVAVDAFSDKRLAASARTFARTNVQLISKIGTRQRDRVAKLAEQALRSGRSMKDVERDLAKILGPKDSMQRRNLRLLARHQVTKLAANITEERHKALGVKRGKWSTSKDGRVRSKHRDYEGRTFRLDQGIGGVRPGEEVGCRCITIPVLPDSLTK